MRGAAQPQVLERRLAAAGEGHDVVEVQAALRAADDAVVALERAAPGFSLEYRAPHVRGDVTAQRGGLVTARARSDGELLLLLGLGQRIERELQDRRDVAAADRAPEQRLHIAQLLVQLLAQRAAQLVGLGRERRMTTFTLNRVPRVKNLVLRAYSVISLRKVSFVSAQN